VSSERKPGSVLLILAVIAVVIGAAAGAAVVLALGDKDRAPQDPAAIECKADPELVAANDALQKSIEEMREELNALRLHAADLQDRLDETAAQAADKNLRAKLPPPYLLKVDDFFESENARTLLASKAQSSRSLTFSPPVFVSSEVITVPYSLDGADHFLIISIDILDYYELRFDVMWDSFEGQ
jgi:hypothetical protein